jgi:glycosyltransferase involved in cell wall biosynthesis
VRDMAATSAQSSRPLRIAMVLPPWYELPPPGYGGIEQVCAVLIDALVARGNDVTLFGAGRETGTPGRLVSTRNEPQHHRLGQILPELAHLSRVDHLLREGSYDVVHDHTTAGVLLAGRRPAPTVVTVHGKPVGDLGDILGAVDGTAALVAISDAQRRLNPGLPWTATVHHGLPVGGLPPSPKGDAPVLWLARFTPDKGPDLAIKACRAAGLPLVLAGKCTERPEQRYLSETVEPMLGPDVTLQLNPGRERTMDLLRSARCLILPIRWEEPFGMVMLEAMASGTPVVALNRGAVPELVRSGETGIICDEPAELPDALREVSAIDREACVERVRQSFSSDLMARRYEDVYRLWMAGQPESTARELTSSGAW